VAEQAVQSEAAVRRRRRVWGLAVAVVAVAFLALVVTSVRDAAVPVGASGGRMPMPGMGPGEGMRMTVRDVDARVIPIPDGRPGVALFVTPRDCAACVDAVRGAARAVQAAPARADLVVVSLDPTTTRGEVASLARAAGRPPARYVVAYRDGPLTSRFNNPSGPGAAVFYDAEGRLVANAASSGGSGRRRRARRADAASRTSSAPAAVGGHTAGALPGAGGGGGGPRTGVQVRDAGYGSSPRVTSARSPLSMDARIQCTRPEPILSARITLYDGVYTYDHSAPARQPSGEQKRTT
jgi:hypothetical protein